VPEGTAAIAASIAAFVAFLSVMRYTVQPEASSVSFIESASATQ
jgi:hypothetical protein